MYSKPSGHRGQHRLSGDTFGLNLALHSCAHTLYKVLLITDHRFGRTRGANVLDIAK